jgi:CDP-4-dehydro-6-deoxyglucose reductase
MSHQIRVRPSGHEFEAQDTETILEAGLRSGLNLPYSCKNGSCGDCLVRLLAGRVEASCHADYPISEAQRSAGWVLGCCCLAASDLEIEAQETCSADQIPEQALKARVAKLEPLGGGTMVMHLRTPRSKLLRFLAGQRVRVDLGDGLVRELPLASCPCDGMNLRCHVPRLPDDAFSDHVFERLRPRQEVQLQGPWGCFTLDEERRRPLLFIAEETGFAAVESLVEHAIALEWEYPIALYWLSGRPGGRYLSNYCRSWVDALDRFRYHELDLARADLRAMVRTLLAEGPTERDWAVYAAVSPTLAAELEPALARAGVGEDRIKLEVLERI